MARKNIIALSASFARDILARRPRWAHYHSASHTASTVAACRRIGRAAGLSAEDLEIVTIAAWFHDTGYAVDATRHEKESAAIARAFLERNNYPAPKIRKVTGCIMATRVPQRPQNLREKVLCDADMASLGQRSFIQQNELLRREVAQRGNGSIDATRWLERTETFLRTHRFHTPYGRDVLDRGRQKNLSAVQRLLRRKVTRNERGHGGTTERKIAAVSQAAAPTIRRTSRTSGAR